MRLHLPRLCLLAALLTACVSTPRPESTASTPPAPWLHPAAGADAGVVRFIAVGDTGMGDDHERAVGATMGQVCAARGCDFVVLLGDNFYPTGVASPSDPQWGTAFLEPFATVRGPFFAVLGNHDYGGGGHGWEPERAQAQVAHALTDPRWVMPATHYAWSWGGVDFFAADTTRSLVGLDDAVRADFKAWLPAATGTWKVAFGHHTLLSNGEHGNAGSYASRAPSAPNVDGAKVKSFLEENVCGKADLYICGHEHTQQWLAQTCHGTELVVSGGGSSSDQLVGHNPTHFEAAELGFLYVTVQGPKLTGEFYSVDGGVEFSRTLTKSPR